jgi:photosystem II stability/assembly factor-like uncharacterized protein
MMELGIRRRRILTLPLLAAGAHAKAATVPAQPQDPRVVQLQGRAAIDRVAVLDAVQVGERIIAVGVRGQVFTSDDRARRQWQPRPTGIERTLTSVVSLDGKRLVALGHHGVVLVSDDLGAHWTGPPVEPGPAPALLSGLALADGRLAAVGGYATLRVSADGGRHWTALEVGGPEADPHFYGIAQVDRSLVLVGEAGLLARTDAPEGPWQRLQSPYPGSLFGVAAMSGGLLVAYGMRGTVMRSADRGRSWTVLASGTRSPFFSATLLKDGRLVLAGKDGATALVSAAADQVETRYTFDRRTVSKVLEDADGGWLLFGDAGVRRVRWNEFSK